MSSPSKQDRLLYNIQLLRAVAATSVVFFHCSSRAGVGLPVSFGSFGVDVFFVISGFLISQILLTEIETTGARRLIRILPFYWTSTLLIFALKLAVPSAFHKISADATTLVTSLLFIPHQQPTGVHPLISLGWTLNYEMYFYALFAIALAVTRKYATLLCAIMIFAVLTVTHLIHPASKAAAFYGQPIVLEFVAGIAVFHLYRWSDKYRALWTRHRGPLAALLALVLLCAIWLPLAQISGHYHPRFIVGGIPAMAIVLGALLLERDFGVKIHSAVALLLGEASYVLYLSHPYIVFGILRSAVPHAIQWSLAPKIALVIVLLAVTSAVAALIHLYFEKPVMDFLKGVFVPKRAKEPLVSLPEPRQ